LDDRKDIQTIKNLCHVSCKVIPEPVEKAMGNQITQVLLENGLKMEISDLYLSSLSIDAVICRQHVVSVR